MALGRAEGEVADLPVHPLAPQQAAVGEPLERKHATGRQQRRQVSRQHHVEIEIESAEAIDRQVSKKIVALNRYPVRIEHFSILWKLSIDEPLHVRVVEE